MTRIKYIIVIIILLLFAIRNIAACQYSFKRIAHNSGLSLLSGFTYGVGETLIHHHSISVFSGVSPTSFFGSRSWERKYKNYPVDQRAKFPGSKTALVAFTDGYHLSRSISRISLNTSTVIYRQPKEKWHRVLDFCILQASFIAGFYLEQILLE